jgi:transcription elongation GreA/GreB family factor
MNNHENHQTRVAALLDEIEARRHELYVRKAAGVRAAGMRNLKSAYHAAQEELAAVTAAAGSAPASSRVARAA